MKKIIFFISISLFSLFFLKQNIYAACTINAPDSTNPSTKINVVTTGIPDWGNGYCPAFVIYGSNNNEIGCYFVPNSTNNRDITTPSSGTFIKIQIENRALDPNVAITNQSCSGKSSQTIYCSKTISLAGGTVSDTTKPPSCVASLTQGNTDYINISFNNASGLGYVYYITDSSGGNHGSGGITSNTASIQVGEGWPGGTYKVEIRESETSSGKGKLLNSCSFYYAGISNLDRLENPQIGNESLCRGNQACIECITNKNSWTALGCLHTGTPSDFVNQLLKFVLGIGGGIAFLLMVFGGLQIILSGGNPEKVKAGKEMLTAAISGLLLIIFSIFIMSFIGYDILRIPGFGK
jgi:hypothetical protein